MAAPGIVLGRSFRLVSSIPRSKFAAATPRSTSIILSYARHNSTFSQFRFPRAATPSIRTFRPQQRTLWGSANPSQSLLAQLEETANKNPTSATAQNAFYQALLRANSEYWILFHSEFEWYCLNYLLIIVSACHYNRETSIWSICNEHVYRGCISKSSSYVIWWKYAWTDGRTSWKL